MRKKAFFKWGIFLPIVIFFLLGCGGKGKTVKTIEGDPELLYKQALARFNKRNYSEALKQFEQLKSSFPDSPPYTIWAELKSGDCHFLKKDYVEAIAAYEEFKKIHPTHEEIPYVQYQIGMCYFNQMLSHDRDQTPTKKALSSFEYLIANAPPSLFTEKAKDKVGVCRKRLADHEFYIGNFYYKKGKFEAAVARFEGFLERFPKNPEEDQALLLLGKTYLELGEWEKAREALTRIVTEYPKGPYSKDTRVILDRGMKEKKASLHKAKAEETRKKGESEGTEAGWVALVKFEEEGRQVVSLKEEKVELRKIEGRTAPPSVTSGSARPVPSTPPPKTAMGVEVKPDEERRVFALPTPLTTPKEKPGKEILSEHEKGKPAETGPVTSSPKTKTEVEIRPDEEKRVGALPITPVPSVEKERPEKRILPEPKGTELGDTRQPIDITSDRVETYSKENLIVFKGNVMARQKDMVIYADSIEAMIIEDGKGIEKIIAGGNVKIQQGLRVASCKKAVFYNLDQKVILTGDPKIWEGDNIVSGDEIIFDIEKNQVEVKGGPSGRGKVKIHPGGEFEKSK